MTNLKPKRCQLENKLQRKDHCKEQVHVVQNLSIKHRLSVKFHSQSQRVDHDQTKDCILKILRRDKPPHLILKPLLRNISTHWFRFQGKFDAVSLEIKENNIRN